MGYLKDRHGLSMMPMKPGTCPICGVNHEPEMPHNKDSLAYQYKFYDENGRWPTWKDAMAHCTPEMKALWEAELKKAGVSID